MCMDICGLTFLYIWALGLLFMTKSLQEMPAIINREITIAPPLVTVFAIKGRLYCSESIEPFPSMVELG